MPEEENCKHVRSGLMSVFSNAVIFELFQRLTGTRRCKNRYVSMIRPERGMKILDIGCGSADILEHLPPDIEYHGYDLQPEYIEYASKKFKGRGKFYCQDVASLDVRGGGSFDVVMVNDTIHHLNNAEAKKVFKTAHSLLKDDGFLSTIDIIKTANQSWLTKTLMSLDRGKNIRTENEYLELLGPDYEISEKHVLNNMHYLPYTSLVLKCTKGRA